MKVTITYEDDSEVTAPLAEWPSVRADGVQTVTIHVSGGRIVFSAHSLYWLYPEGESFVVGSGSVRYDPNPLTEIVIAPNGVQIERKVEFMPDLKHNQIKLGWWKHG